MNDQQFNFNNVLKFISKKKFQNFILISNISLLYQQIIGELSNDQKYMYYRLK